MNLNYFEDTHMQSLKEKWSNFEKVDPASESYQKLIDLLDRLPSHLIKQLAESNIKFVSMLARHRCS